MLTLYTAKSIITMNHSQPRATAVAVEAEQIVEVGSLESLQHRLAKSEYELDTQFADAILIPGFIDPHLHPAMAAVLLPMHFITALPWKFPWGDVPATTTPDDYDSRLRAIAKTHPRQDLLITFGHHALWHGDMNRARLNNLVPELPVVVWNRSFHELCMNDAALEFLAITPEAVGNRPQIDLSNGRFFEVGLGYAIQKLNPIILSDEWFKLGLARLRDTVHYGGHTTIGDMAVGIFDFEKEMNGMQELLDQTDVPFRTELIPHGIALERGRDAATAQAFVNQLPSRNTHRLRYAKRIKLFADGAFFSGLAQLKAPGYLDGHHGEWLMPPPQLEAAINNYWEQEYQIHVHVTGDLALDLVLDILQTMQNKKPRYNHGFTIEHFGLSTPEQVSRAADLGANVSANVYYLHELSDIYAREAVGYERASQMARVGECFRQGITTAFHSDFTMAPAEPLNSMWVAVNRINCAGELMGAHECVTADQALAAVTINAAKILGRADDIGSIRAGKKADFTVLAEDPLAVEPMRIRDIQLLATIFEGQVFPIDSA